MDDDDRLYGAYMIRVWYIYDIYDGIYDGIYGYMYEMYECMVYIHMYLCICRVYVCILRHLGSTYHL